MICSNCKKQIRDGIKFCPLCGAEVIPEMEIPEKRNGNRGPILIAIVAILIVVTVVVLLGENHFGSAGKSEGEKTEVSDYNISSERDGNGASAIADEAEGSGQSSDAIPDFSGIKVGDVIVLGRYEQDNNLKDGQEELEWKVLDIDNGKALIITKYIIDAIKYNDERVDVTWENCSLRKWLNDDFYNDTFTAAEQAVITETKIRTDDNPYYDTAGGGDTIDKIFCLSVDEAKRYYSFTAWYYDEGYGYSEELLGVATDFAKTKNMWSYTFLAEDSEWLNEVGYSQSLIGETRYARWLRDPGEPGGKACDVHGGGSVGKNKHCAVVDDGRVGITPAMWISIQGEETSAQTNSDSEKEKDTKTETAKNTIIKAEDINVGDTISLGHYEQDGDFTNGQEKLRWIVVAIEDGKALLLTDYVIDSETPQRSMIFPWNESEAREWLNGDFLNSTFSDDEQSIIQTTYLADTNTDDKVFYLSVDEFHKYFDNWAERLLSGEACFDPMTTNTPYANQRLGENISGWILRNPRTTVNSFGEITEYEEYIPTFNAGIRPAMWVEVE